MPSRGGGGIRKVLGIEGPPGGAQGGCGGRQCRGGGLQGLRLQWLRRQGMCLQGSLRDMKRGPGAVWSSRIQWPPAAVVLLLRTAYSSAGLPGAPGFRKPPVPPLHTLNGNSADKALLEDCTGYKHVTELSLMAHMYICETDTAAHDALCTPVQPWHSSS
jgi:hypothetical protein